MAPTDPRSSIPFYALPDPGAWWPALERLAAALAPTDASAGSPTGGAAAALRTRHAALGAALVGGARADPFHAAAAALLRRPNPYAAALARLGPAEDDPESDAESDAAAAAAGRPPEGLRAAVRHDLGRLIDALARVGRTDAAGRAAPRALQELPPLRELAPPPRGPEAELSAALQAAALGSGRPEAASDTLLAALEPLWRRHGAGPLALAGALRWDANAGELVAIDAAHAPEPLEALVGLEWQLERLDANVAAFVAGRPALHTLLYGPRGSGKSSAVRALLPRYRETGLRLLELPPDRLPQLPEVLAALRGAPQRIALFCDDLSFDAGDDAYRPLKSLLEGSLAAPPENVLAVATSNRRHLVAERHSARPDPLDDDVHAWDTHHERLALADRFGLAITFPGADRRRYLEIARARAAAAGLEPDDGDLFEREAIRFAEWGNGYSGRSAAQFVTRWRQRD